MTHDRRHFLKLGLVGTAAWAVGCRDRGTDVVPVHGRSGAVVLSTWKHGVQANARAWELLSSGSSILDAVQEGVAAVESDLSNRSVGLGGRPDRDGFVTLDACLQDHDGRAGAVAFVQGFENPIRIARAVMDRTPHVLLVGAGAERWALENGFTKREVVIDAVQEEWREWLSTSRYKPEANIENHDTIGMIGMSEDGILAGACTTSGLAYKVHGRVGDSPIIGAGLFVDGDVGAACATGVGELVLRTAGSHAVVELMRHGASPEEACHEVVERIRRKNPDVQDMQVGFLALRRDGVFGAYALQKGFNYALRTADQDALVNAPFT
jgi:N4-(beta-N-acetylglucosaminyl)-L-asparaginase